MPKRRTTYKTFSLVTRSIARKVLASALALCAQAALCAQTPVTIPNVETILKNHVAALRAMHLREPKTHETLGRLEGLGYVGTFHEWQDGDKQRRDERLGLATERELRVGGRLWVQNAGGQVRELKGVAARRQVTEDFLDSATFAAHPEFVKFLQAAKLDDGRAVYQLRVAPPGGEVYTVSIDATTWLIDQKAYALNDATRTITYSDYRITDGLLLPFEVIDSPGSPDAALRATVTKVIVDQPIAADTFASLAPLQVDIAAPVTVPVEVHGGLPFVPVKVGDHLYHFLLDSGSQGNVIDPRVASELGLHPEGRMEINGAERANALGLVDLPVVSVGGAELPSQVASVFDLSKILSHYTIDGVLGSPFFASAELRLDPDAQTLTVAKPGSLPERGQKLGVDTDRELVEIDATVNRAASAKMIVDTGDTKELLLYEHFIDAHPGLVEYAGNRSVQNRGAGGSTRAITTTVDELQVGKFSLYNRISDIILASNGAFADRIDGGNIGYASLKNFVTTFDVVNHALYLDPARSFDDGRRRARYEENDLPPHSFTLR